MITVNVARSIGEAKIQDKTGAAIISIETDPSETNPQGQLNSSENGRDLDIKSVEHEKNLKSNETSEGAIEETDKSN